MRVIRNANANVSPSDDARLFEKVHTDGLFEDASITSLGSNQVSIPALYGIMEGREFTSEAQTLLVTLPSTDSGTGYVIIRYNTTTQDVISFKSELAPYTPVYEDINTTGTICEMIIATYVASAVAITSISGTYKLSKIKQENQSTTFLVSASGWSTSTTTLSGVDYYTYDIALTKVNDSDPSGGIGTASGVIVPTEDQQTAYDSVNYVYCYPAIPKITLYATDKPTSDFYVQFKGVS